MLSEFSEFIAKGNVMDLAVGVIIGAAFQKIVDSLVNDIVMPVVGLATGGTDFTNMFVGAARRRQGRRAVRVARGGKAAGATVIALRLVRHPGDSVPDPGVGRVPDGEGRQPHAQSAPATPPPSA